MLSARHDWIVAVGLFALLLLPLSLVFKGLGELRRTWTGKHRK